MAETLSERALTIEEYGKQSFLRPMQRQELERSISGIEERLANPTMLEFLGGDPEALEKQLIKEQGMLEQGTPPHLDIAGQRRVYTKMKKCEDIIVNGLPTFTMMERGRPQDVDHHVSHENAPHRDEDGKYTTKRAIQAWKNYRLTLDPNSIEPNFLSVASLRTDTVRGNPALFRKNYDHIRFRELIEENLADQLDDETYYTFCGLKVLEWTEATICRKFDWTQKMYDVAMARWRGDTGKTNLPPTDPASKIDFIPSEYSESEYANTLDEGHQPSLLNPAYTNDEMVTGKDTKDAWKQEHPAALEPVKRGPHRPTGAVLQRSYEPRVQIEPGWPKEELQKYGIGVGEFCKAWGQKSSTLFYKFAKDGQWVERHLKTARAALARLQQKARGAEPSVDEPALAYDSTEPVAV